MSAGKVSEAQLRRQYALGQRCPECGTTEDIIDNGLRDPARRSYQHAITADCEGLCWDMEEYLDEEE